MSTLAERVSRLETRLGPCPDCRGVSIELRYPGAPAAKAPVAERCGSCDEPLQQIAVLLAFDPDSASAR